MGGSDKILARGRELDDEGKYLLASEIINKLVQAEPDNEAAKDMLADIFEQIGYQQENPGLRNSFLAAAYELRSGIPQGETADSSSPDVIRAMSTELFLNFLGIRMDSRKAEGLRFTINLITPDNGEKFLVELDNATLTNIKGFVAPKPDLTLTINRSDLEQTMMGAKSLEAQIEDGTAKVEGDASTLPPWSTSTRASRSCPARRPGNLRSLGTWNPVSSESPILTKPFRARRSQNSQSLRQQDHHIANSSMSALGH